MPETPVPTRSPRSATRGARSTWRSSRRRRDPTASRWGRCWPRPATPRSTAGSSTPRRPRARSATSTATRASCATAATRSSSWREKSTFIEVSYLLIYGELPTADELEKFTTQIQRHTLLHEDLKRFFDGFPRNAHPMPVLSSAVNALSRVLPGLGGPAGQGAGRAVDDPAAGQAAHDRRLRLQEVGRPAVPLPGQLADAGGELPADDVRVPGRALRGRPRDRAGAGPAADPARRSRAELLDVDGAAGRLVAGQPVHVDLRRHQRAVGPAARRRQPGGAGDAGEDQERAAATSRSSSARSRTARTA